MTKLKIGRNDPCPCGSGKKYKNCCISLENDINADDNLFIRYSQLISSIKIKLDQEYNSQIKKIRKDVQTRFLHFSTPDHFTKDHESLLSDWLWFDMTDSEENTFGFEYLMKNGPYLEEVLFKCLEALTVSYLSVYETLGMDGDDLLVKDIFTGTNTRILVKEPLEDIDLSKDKPLLLGRVVFMPLGRVFSGMVFMLNDKDGEREFISRHVQYLQDLLNEDKILSLLKFNTPIIYGIFDHAYFKTLLSLNDIRIISINETEKQALEIKLNESSSFTPVHNTAGIQWYKPLVNRGYARIGIHSEYLVASNDIIDDLINMLEYGKELLPDHEWQIVNSRFLVQAPSSELADIWFNVIKERESERWLNTVHRELDDKTPVEVLGEADGKDRLQALLDDFAASAADRAETAELIEYMRLRVSSFQ